MSVPEMPYYDASLPSQYQVYMSTFTMDTFFSSFLEAAAIKGWINSSMIPADSPVQLTTNGMNTYLPGIEAYYGPDLPVDIKFQVLELGDFTVQENNPNLGGVVTLQLEFWVETAPGVKELATSMTLVDTAFHFTVLVNDMVISMNLGTVNVDKITINYCSFGNLSAFTLKVELNNFFRIFTPVINRKLAKHPVTFPSNIFGMFLLSDLTIGYFNDYLYLGFTPTFIGLPPFHHATTKALSVEELLQIVQ